MTRRVAIAGVALSDIGRVDDLTPFTSTPRPYAGPSPSRAHQGRRRRLRLDGTGTPAPIEVAEYLGLKPTWIDSTGVGGGTWEIMAAHAVDAIARDRPTSSSCPTARPPVPTEEGPPHREPELRGRGPVQYEVPYGHTLIAKYGMAANRHRHEYGTTMEQLAEIAVSHRYNAGFNPDAYYREPITVDDVLAGPMIADPFTKLQCCIRSDGGCAVVLVAEDRVADCRTGRCGCSARAARPRTRRWRNGATSAPVRRPCRAPRVRRAGVTPDDIDLCCIYDAFTFMVLETLEDLGFCAKGDGGPFVADGRLRLGGALPTNPDGGGLSACHPGMRGLFLLVEATRQLRGEYAAAARRSARWPTPSWPASRAPAAGSAPTARSSSARPERR